VGEVMSVVSAQIHDVHDHDVGEWPADLVKTYTTPEVAEFFGRAPTWVHWGLRKKQRSDGVFVAAPWTRADGSAIAPKRHGARKERRFTLEDIRDIALARYRRHDLTELEMKAYLEIIDRVERGQTELLHHVLPAPPSSRHKRDTD